MTTKLEKQIEEYLEWCEMRQLSKSTIYVYRIFFKNFAKEIPARSIGQISNQMLEDFVKSKNWTGSTINLYMVEIKTMLRFFKKKGERFHRLNLDQIAKVKETPRRKVFYTREQISRVLSGCDDLEWLLIKLCFDCGLRIHELAALRLSNLDGLKITFIGKGRKIRETYMTNETRIRLDAWIRQRNVTDFLWTKTYKNAKTKVFSLAALGRIMENAFRRNGYNDFHPHALRHSFATEICRNGAPLEIAKEMLGHTNIETTIRYVHSLEGQLEKAFSKYRYEVNS